MLIGFKGGVEMRQVLCSTGTLLGRPNGRNYLLLLDFENKLHCDGLELMFYNSWYEETDAIYHVIKQLSRPIPVFHVEKDICAGLSKEAPLLQEEALQKFRLNCQLAAAVGAKLLVFHLWDGWMDDETIQRNMRFVPDLTKIAERENLTLTIENIVCAQKDPFHYCMQLVDKYPQISFTYDTKMSAFHQKDELLFQPEYQPLFSRIRHFHVNDYAGGFMDWQNFKTLYIGHGQVDFERLFEKILPSSYAGDFTTEATSFDQTGTVHFDKLNETLQKLYQYKNGDR